MGASMRVMVGLLCTYVFTWTASFAFMFMLRDEVVPWDLYVSYFVMAWTFRAGEIPASIWLMSVVAFVPLAALVVIVMRRRGRAK
jgi:hypothetical protein